MKNWQLKNNTIDEQLAKSRIYIARINTDKVQVDLSVIVHHIAFQA